MTSPLPEIAELNRPFWDACRASTLVLQRCLDCGRLRYPIARYCPHCLSSRATWEPVSGGGEVYTFAVFRHAYNVDWRDRVPYTVALVKLAEGPCFLSDLVGVRPEEVRVGLPVEVVFEAVTDEITVPRFTPLRTAPRADSRAAP
jgi:uncharacterized OB-fold protein